jgi:eukaryotic-like serine/threonine-protein kinase
MVEAESIESFDPDNTTNTQLKIALLTRYTTCTRSTPTAIYPRQTMAIQIWQEGDKIKNDRFHILKQLGSGYFGITYLAEDKQKSQQVVIKTLNASHQSKADFVQKQGNFVNEGFILKAFNHLHIVRIYELIQIGDLSGLVMEYIPGQDLDDHIKENGPLSEAEALNYIDQIAQALDCVHQQKFFHRDVKPHNIMLRQDRDEAVLIDFGIAKEFVDLETIYLSNTSGTEIYKPIEQWEKIGRFGAFTDIYASCHIVSFANWITSRRWFATIYIEGEERCSV